MSKQSDNRWALVTWAYNHGHTLEESIDLVDCIEDRVDAVLFADDDDAEVDAKEELESMRESVTTIYTYLKDRK